jgi:hypothetical protein
MDGSLTSDDEQATLHRITELRALDASLRQIATALNAEGYKAETSQPVGTTGPRADSETHGSSRVAFPERPN